MTPGDNDHGACVDAWLVRVAAGLPPDQELRAFDQAFAALWQRAHRTLGDVTLMAITDRVLYSAAESFPALSALEVDSTGLRTEGLRDGVAHSRGSLADGYRFVLVHFLTVLGNLTAEILTPALHAELSKVVAPAERAPDEKEATSEPRNAERSEESQS